MPSHVQALVIQLFVKEKPRGIWELWCRFLTVPFSSSGPYPLMSVPGARRSWWLGLVPEGHYSHHDGCGGEERRHSYYLLKDTHSSDLLLPSRPHFGTLKTPPIWIQIMSPCRRFQGNNDATPSDIPLFWLICKNESFLKSGRNVWCYRTALNSSHSDFLWFYTPSSWQSHLALFL